MSRPRVYRTAEEKRDKHRAYMRLYQRKKRKLYSRAPYHGAHADTVASRPSDEMLADAERRNALVYQSVTAALCGDPKPGQSALDQHKTRFAVLRN